MDAHLPSLFESVGLILLCATITYLLKCRSKGVAYEVDRIRAMRCRPKLRLSKCTI